MELDPEVKERVDAVDGKVPVWHWEGDMLHVEGESDWQLRTVMDSDRVSFRIYHPEEDRFVYYRIEGEAAQYVLERVLPQIAGTAPTSSN